VTFDQTPEVTAAGPPSEGAPGSGDPRAAAIWLATKGFRVFRVDATTLRPLRKGWTETASSDPAFVRADFSDPLGYSVADNVAILTGDSLLVVDVDVKDSQPGLESLAQLEKEGLRRDTFTVRTPSGGLHLYYNVDPTFEYPGRRNWRPGIDIRGHHGIAFALGSTKPGVGDYEIINDAPLADGFAGELRRGRRTTTDINSEVDSSYEDDWSIGQAIEFLKTAEPEAGNGKRHDPLIRIGHELFDLGITPQSAAQLIEEHWPEAANVTEDIAYHISNLASSRLKDPAKLWGIDHPRRRPSVYLTFERVELRRRVDEGPTIGTAGAGLAPRAIVAPSTRRIPKRPWLILGYIAREIVTALIAPGGIGKTQWTASVAVAVVTGRQDILDLPIKEKTKVWIWNQEDEENELDRRTAAVLQHFGVSDGDLLDEKGDPCLFVNSGVDKPLMLAMRGANGAMVFSPDVAKVVEYIKKNGIGLLVLDPIAEMHEGEENDNAQMRLVWSAARTIAVRARCSVLVAAHSRKPDKASSAGHAGDQDSLRGASSQGAVIRAAFTMLNMSVADAKKLNVKEEDRGLYVRLDNAKANRSFLPGGAKWLKRVSIDIEAPFGGEPEHVGVLAPVSFADRVIVERPNPADVLARIFQEIAKPGERIEVNRAIDALGADERASFGLRTNWPASVKAAIRAATGRKPKAEFVKGKATVSVNGGTVTFYKGERRTAPLEMSFVLSFVEGAAS
jgi:AAA domain/Bifunctional DNA primase/polymerase, N-terminal